MTRHCHISLWSVTPRHSAILQLFLPFTCRSGSQFICLLSFLSIYLAYLNTMTSTVVQSFSNNVIFLLFEAEVGAEQQAKVKNWFTVSGRLGR